MQGEKGTTALARIDAAMVRIEAAAMRLAETPAASALRAEVVAALSEIDRLIDDAERDHG